MGPSTAEGLFLPSPVRPHAPLFDSFALDRPVRRVATASIASEGETWNCTIGLEPGKAAHPDEVEDQAIVTIRRDGTFACAVLDGVGENWTCRPEERAHLPLDGHLLTLGNVPGYLLTRELLNSTGTDSISDITVRAAARYRAFLREHGFAPNRERHRFGGCTFSAVLGRVDGTLEVSGCGDTIAIIKRASPSDSSGLSALTVTPNQLARLNTEHAAAMRRLVEQHGIQAGRQRFFDEVKVFQRNHQANRLYGFFDGDPRCVSFIVRHTIRPEEVSGIVLLTDGAYPSAGVAAEEAAAQQVELLEREGTAAVLRSQQGAKSPEATLIALLKDARGAAQSGMQDA